MNKFWLHGLILIFIPGITYVVAGVSMSLGLVACSLIGVFIESRTTFSKIYSYKNVLIFLLGFLLLILWGFYCLIKYGEYKPIYSSLIVFIFLYAFILSKQFLKLNVISSTKLLNDLRFLTFLLIFLGWIKIIIGSDFGPYANHPKPLFPYAEDSHYALTLAMFSLGYICGNKHENISSIFILLNILSLSLLLPSLTMVIVFIVGLTAFFVKKNRALRLAYFSSLIFIPSIAITLLLSIEYFNDRINLNTFTNLTSDSLTLLVWFQGWFLIFSTLEYSNFFGMGFQMLGYEERALPYITEFIADFFNLQTMKNVEDGGFLSAKIIGEFGIFGILFVFLYLIKVLEAYGILTRGFNYRKMIKKDNELLLRISSGFIFAFVIEMFLRGLGYFSVGTIMFVVSYLTFLNTEKYQKR